jgi:hypothetical protein
MARKKRPIYTPFVFADEDDAQDAIDDRWLPYCPAHHPVEPKELLGYTILSPRLLRVEVSMRGFEDVCDVVVDEGPDLIRVRATACANFHNHPVFRRSALGDPSVITLNEALGDRVVIDYETEEPVPVYVPPYLHGRRTADPGTSTDQADGRAAAERPAKTPRQRNRRSSKRSPS